MSDWPDWVVQIKIELSSLQPLPPKEDLLERTQKPRMYKIPDTNTEGYIDQEFGDIYKPYKVSLGPWYADIGETVKKEALLHCLRRPGNKIESYLTALREVVDDLRDAYDGLSHTWRNDTELFLKMMLLDGCFLLEFIYTARILKWWPGYTAYDLNFNPAVSRILENKEEKKCYLHDILLLQNQVPLMLLESLLKVGVWGSAYSEADPYDFLEVITATFIPISRLHKIEPTDFRSSLHILDLYRRILVYRDFERGKNPLKKKPQQEFYRTSIPSATELHKIGIGFTTSNSTSLLDVSLHRKKTLKLPVIVVDGSTKSTFLNFIAFEQLHKDIVTKNEVTSYMYFMGCLVQDIDDVRLLQSRGIIVTTFPPFEVTKLFCRMCRDISLENDALHSKYVETLAMVRARYNKLSNEWRKDLFQTYLKSPWAIISVVAAILLFTLSIIQTVYTVLSYVRPK